MLAPSANVVDVICINFLHYTKTTTTPTTFSHHMNEKCEDSQFEKVYSHMSLMDSVIKYTKKIYDTEGFKP